MRICVLDFATTASLPAGWDRARAAGRPAEVTFCPMTPAQARAARLEGDHLHLDEAENVPRTPLSDCGAFVLHGIAPGPATLIDWLQTHGIAGEMEDRPQVVSFGMFQRTWDAHLGAGPLPGLLSLLRARSAAPILLIPEPMPPESLLQEKTARARFCTTLCETGDGPYLRDLADRLMAPHLQGETYLLGQPVETTLKMVLTQEAYLDSPDTYCALLMDQVLDALGVARQPRSTMTEPTE